MVQHSKNVALTRRQRFGWPTKPLCCALVHIRA